MERHDDRRPPRSGAFLPDDPRGRCDRESSLLPGPRPRSSHCGNRFMDSATSLGEILNALGGARRVLYFGDLDPQGLLIPQAASDRTRAAGLPAVEPHLWSYRQLLALGTPQHRFGEGQAHSPALCDWLGDCAEPARRVLDAGDRLAQEHVGWEFLRQQLVAEA